MTSLSTLNRPLLACLRRLAPVAQLMAGTLAAALALPAAAQTLTVSAAASLSNVLKELAPRYEAAKPGVKLQTNFAASGVLLQQIGQGAPVDVFISADEDTIRRGIEQKLFDASSRRDIAANELVLVVPADGGSPVNGLADLAGPKVQRIAVGKLASVPAGRYAKQALEAVKLWAPLEPKLVYADSVRQVLDYVARGEVEAGFVYATDAAIMPDKVVRKLVAGGHDPVRYPAILVSEGRQKALANDFLAFLVSAPAQDVLAKYGFVKP